jgi:hypothetical protein
MAVLNDPTWFWRMTGFIGIGHVTYMPDQLHKEGPFTNPARMIEDIMGHDSASELLDGRSESEFWAAVWAHAGWWDQKDGRIILTRDAIDNRNELIP